MRGKDIDKGILQLLKSENRPLSTREISLKIKVNWHPVTNHCLRLQMNGLIEGYRIGRINAWKVKEDGK